MSAPIKQSSIASARDELFLDTADSQFLNIVTSNQGFNRPAIGFSDDAHFRAVAKKFMLQPKSVLPIFARILENMIGPQYSRTSTLAVASSIGDDILTVTDASDLIQVGTLILDPGLASEETVDIVFKDIITNKLYLKSKTIKNHGIQVTIQVILKTDVTIGGTSLILLDSSYLPTSGYPYSVLVDKNTENEEIVTVSNNNTGTNTLTVSALTKNHSGFKASYLQKPLHTATVIGRTFIELDDLATRNFPSSGYIRINGGTGTEEIIFYNLNTISNNTLQFIKPLIHNHSVGEPIELLFNGSLIESLNILQQGIYWQIYDTTARLVQIYIPKSHNLNNILSASWIHGPILSPFSTTLASPTTTTDTVLTLTSVSGLSDTGMVLLNASIYFYTNRNTNTNQITLTEQVGAILAPGAPISLYQIGYAGTSLQEGNPRDSSGSVQPDEFPGPYIYDPTQRAPSLIQSTLSARVLPATRVASNQVAGVTNLEVLDASMWPVITTPFSVKIGSGSGYEETRTIIDRTLKLNLSTTVATNPDSHTITAADTTGFPESDGSDPAGYRIIINKGGGNEEIATVKINMAGTPGTFVLSTALANSHIAAEPITLLNDVLTFDKLINAHIADSVNPSVYGHLVEPYTSQLSLASAASFPLAIGMVWLNYGNGSISARSKVTGPGGPVFTLDSTANFPTSNFPYQVILGEGQYNQEVAFVSANNVGASQLTLTTSPVNTHIVGEYVKFNCGNPEVVEYTTKLGNILEFSSPKVLNSYHNIGESVIFSPDLSIPPTSGFGYSLKMPPDINANLQILFDLGRAAGVKVTIINNR